MASAAIGGPGDGRWGDGVAAVGGAPGSIGDVGAGQYVRQHGHASDGPLDGVKRPLAADPNDLRPDVPDAVRLRSTSQNARCAPSREMGAAGRAPAFGFTDGHGTVATNRPKDERRYHHRSRAQDRPASHRFDRRGLPGAAGAGVPTGDPGAIGEGDYFADHQPGPANGEGRDATPVANGRDFGRPVDRGHDRGGPQTSAPAAADL